MINPIMMRPIILASLFITICGCKDNNDDLYAEHQRRQRTRLAKEEARKEEERKEAARRAIASRNQSSSNRSSNHRNSGSSSSTSLKTRATLAFSAGMTRSSKVKLTLRTPSNVSSTKGDRWANVSQHIYSSSGSIKGKYSFSYSYTSKSEHTLFGSRETGRSTISGSFYLDGSKDYYTIDISGSSIYVR